MTHAASLPEPRALIGQLRTQTHQSAERQAELLMTAADVVERQQARIAELEAVANGLQSDYDERGDRILRYQRDLAAIEATVTERLRRHLLRDHWSVFLNGLSAAIHRAQQGDTDGR